MALVVNAGLKELVLEAPPPPKIKQSFLGAFPYPNHLGNILEEEYGEGEETKGEVIVIDGTAANGDGDEDDNDNEDNNKGVESEDEEDEEDKESKQQDPQDSDDEEVTHSKSKRKNATNQNCSNELDELTKAVSFMSVSN